MNRTILVASALAVSFGLIFSVSVSPNVGQVYGQQNQTGNATSTQQEQQGQQNQTTGIGSASEIENMTAGNIPVLGNETDIQSQSKNDTSIMGGLQKEQLTTDTNMTDNQTGAGGAGATTNETAATNQTGGGATTNETTTTTPKTNQTDGGEGQQGNQTEKGPIEQIGEAITDVFEGGGGNPSN